MMTRMYNPRVLPGTKIAKTFDKHLPLFDLTFGEVVTLLRARKYLADDDTCFLCHAVSMTRHDAWMEKRAREVRAQIHNKIDQSLLYSTSLEKYFMGKGFASEVDTQRLQPYRHVLRLLWIDRLLRHNGYGWLSNFKE